jgi:hypothetical protein
MLLIKPNINQLILNYSLGNIDNYILMLKNFIKNKNFNPEITLLEFYKITNKTLHLIGFNFTKQKETIFNELKNNFIDNYQSINNIKESKLNFNTPKDAILSIDFILEKIKKYAVSRDAEILNKQVWNRIVIKQ